MPALSACQSGEEGNFSQWAGFDEYFRDYPPDDESPDEQTKKLLKKFSPRFYLAHHQTAPLDFYKDYIAAGRLKDGRGKTVQGPVTQSILNRYKKDPGAVFVHKAGPGETSPVIYARMDEAEIRFPSGRQEKFRFLQYTAVFRHSGVARGIKPWQEVLLGLVGNLDDWHQLDHYTSATVVIDRAEKPIALFLQQHNGVRSYLLGEAVSLPADARVAIDIALRSNELYPHMQREKKHPAVGYMTVDSMPFLMGLHEKAGSFNETQDLTKPERLLDYRLGFLPSGDAFYVFQGYLGKKRLLPGRTGPPGAAYNNFGALKPWNISLFLGYWRDKNAGDLERIRKAFELAVEKNEADGRYGESIRKWAEFARLQSFVFEHNLNCLRRHKKNCRLK